MNDLPWGQATMFHHLESPYQLDTPWGVLLHLVSLTPQPKKYGVCEQCGSPIELHTPNGKVRKYCDRDCASLARVERKKAGRLEQILNPGIVGTTNCLWCGNEILARTTNNIPRKYCGPECTAKHNAFKKKTKPK